MLRSQHSLALALVSVVVLAVASGCAARAAEIPRAAAPAPAFVFDTTVPADQRDEIEADEALATRWIEQELGVVMPAVRIMAAPDGEAFVADIQQRYGPGLPGDPDLREMLQTAAAVTVGHDVLLLTDGRWNRMGREERSFIVAHELFHVVQYQLASGRGQVPAGVNIPGPSWLIEGAADFVAANVVAASGGRSVDQYRDSYRLSAGSVATALSELEPSGPHVAWGADAAYTLGFLATDALVSGSNIRALREIWRSAGNGTTWEHAFQTAFGLSPDDFYRTFEANQRGS